MFWDYFRPYKRRADAFADLLPWASLIGKNDIVRCKDESLLAVYRVEALDLASLSPYEIGVYIRKLNIGWKRLESGWGVWMDVVRRKADMPPRVPISHPMADMIDRDHRETYDPQLYANTTYLSLWHHLPTGPQQAVRQLWSADDVTEPDHLEAFRDGCAATIDILRSGTKAIAPVTDDALLTYLHGITSDEWYDVVTPDIPDHLDYVLTDCSLLPGWRPRLYRDEDTGVYLSALSVKAFPTRLYAAMLSDLYRLPIQFRLVTRWLPQETEAMRREFTRQQQKQVAKEYGLREVGFEWLTGHKSRMTNRFNQHQADDTDLARFEMLTDDVGFGDLSVTVVIADPDLNSCKVGLREVERIMRTNGLITVREWYNATGAYLGTLPGIATENPRRFRLSTLNAIHLNAFHDPWAGKPRNEIFQAPALSLAKTAECNPYWLDLHSGNNAHSLVPGPSDCHAPGTEILMYDGSLKKIEDILVGDHVMGPDSQRRCVLELHQGSSEMVEIIPIKGEPFVVTLNHILSLQRTRDGHSARKVGELVDIRVRDWLTQSRTFQSHHKLYRRGVEFSCHANLPIDPYVLGVLLGDGSLSEHGVRVTKPDPEIRAAVDVRIGSLGCVTHTTASNSSGCPTFSIIGDPDLQHRGSGVWVSKYGTVFVRPYRSNPIIECLRGFGLLNLQAGEKYIPDIYKTATRLERLEILAGILDTDGHLSAGATFDYISKSECLSSDVAFIARSLGLAAYITPCIKRCQNGFIGQYYRVSITGDTDMIPCQVPRKKAHTRLKNADVLVTGFSVKPAGVGEYYGFVCDGDHRYLMGDFTVVHNSGKSTLMKFLASQAQRFDGIGRPQLFWFDVKRSARLFILCMGGKYLDLGRDEVNFQPLRDIEQRQARTEAYTWLLDRLKEGNIKPTPRQEEHVQDALKRVAEFPRAQRTMSELLRASSWLSTGLQKMAAPGSVNPMTGARDHSRRDRSLDEFSEVRKILKPYTKGEIYGHLFDADHDDIADTQNLIIGIEEEGVMATPQLLVPCLSHIWRYLYPRFTGIPTQVVVDEAGEQLKYEVIRQWVDKGLRMFREKKVSMMLATQNHLDFVDSDIGPMLRSNCLNMLLLPNPNAMAEDTLPSYEALGLRKDEVREHIAGATRQQDVYHVCPEGRRLVHLRLSPLGAAICGPASPETHRRIDELLAAEGHEMFPGAYLRGQGFIDEAKEWERRIKCHG
jgi:type IV secretory pathway VirB4 component